MIITSFTISGELPTFNEYSTLERSNKFAAARMKKDTEERIMWEIPNVSVSDHVFVYFTWIRSNAKRDKDNVAFAKKFILDALQKKGVIKRDSWTRVTPLDHAFYVNRSNPRTIVTISTERIEDWN